MLKLAGVVCILAGGVVFQQKITALRRRERNALHQLSGLLFYLSADIRLRRRTMPELIAQRGFGEEADHFLGEVIKGLERHRNSFDSAWIAAADKAPLSDREKEELAMLTNFFASDALSLSEAFSAAAQSLRNAWEERCANARMQDRLAAALCAGSCILLFILLL